MNYSPKSMSVTTAAIMLLVAVGCEEPNITTDDRFQEVLETKLDEYGGMGVSAAVIMPNSNIWTGAAGVSNETARITTSTRFNTLSGSLIYTSALVLDLAEDNILSIDDKISEWLPPFDNVDSTILLWQLLNHTSGVYNFSENEELIPTALADPSRLWTPQEVLETFVLEPYGAPGTVIHYSGTGYLLLGLIVEAATRSDFATVLQERILDPLGLDRTSLVQSETIPDDIAIPWADLNDDGGLDDLSFLIPAYNSAYWVSSGVYTTAEDQALFLRALMEGSIIGPESLDEMLRYQWGSVISYNGLGIDLVFATDTSYAIGVGATSFGYSETLFFMPEDNAYISEMQNNEDSNMAIDIWDLFMEIIREDY
jgi:D-alanyl-D-alanine carboxypeptidase